MTQTSLAAQGSAAAAVVVMGMCLGVSAAEWCMLAMAIGLVLMAEIFNTAIESLARGPGSRRHPRLRDALDMASAAVLTAAIAAAVVGTIIFFPKLATLLRVI